MERVGPARAATFAALLAPIVLVLVGFVGGSFDGATRLVARLTALALVVGLASSLRRWPRAITAGCLAVYVLGILWVFARPDGRHPTLMAVALLSGVLVAIEPFLDRIERRDRTVVAPVVVIAAVAGFAWIVAMSPLPLRVRVSAAQGAMDERAAQDLMAQDLARDLARDPARDPAQDLTDRGGEPARPSFDCVGGQVPNLEIGPYPVCHRRAGRSQVVYDLGKPFLGLGDKTITGLVYAPDGAPRFLDDDACIAPITGAWYEYTRPGDGGACPPGQHRADD